VRFAERPGTDPTKRPIREIVGVDPRLNQRWSTRRAHINFCRGELAIQFQNDHGRPPTPVEALQLAQQATLETRDALDAGQASLVRRMCTSDARLQLAIAPAGAGKTTAMRALALAWTQDGGQVLGLAPSAAAAAVLGEQTDIRADTLAWSLDNGELPDWAAAVGPSTLVITGPASEM
jgi:hypothetical protein